MDDVDIVFVGPTFVPEIRGVATVETELKVTPLSTWCAPQVC